MSGPVSTEEAAAERGAPAARCIEVTDDRETIVGRMPVRRALPRRGRRTVGAWCFADHFGPAQATENAGIDIGPHPHIGLQTVTWPVLGEILHRNSLGSEQLIAPGQLNLMTAGNGVAHAEEATGTYRGPLHGVQLWVAQPEATRHGEPEFEHHGELPVLEIGAGEATVLVGEVAGARSPARHDTPLAGAELALVAGRSAVPLSASFEYALMVLDGEVTVDGVALVPGRLAYLGLGRDELSLAATGRSRTLLLGGEPFPEPVRMWWNFVAREPSELDEAYRDWRDGAERFGPVASSLERIPAPAPFWSR